MSFVPETKGAARERLKEIEGFGISQVQNGKQLVSSSVFSVDRVQHLSHSNRRKTTRAATYAARAFTNY